MALFGPLIVAWALAGYGAGEQMIEFGDERVHEKLWHKIRVDDDGCWMWEAAKSRYGYGQVNGKSYGYNTNFPHRIFYMAFVGEIPERLQIDHICHDPNVCPGGFTCKHRRCVHPEHLKLSTNDENHAKGRVNTTNVGRNHSEKTHCPKGHPYSGENLRIKYGSRLCRECARQEVRARRLAKKAAGSIDSPRDKSRVPENS
jgi:HNH endonuclease